MSRKFRRFSFRLCAAATTLAVGAFAHHRWGLRRGSACLTVPERVGPVMSLSPAERRAAHLAALRLSSPGAATTDAAAAAPFDLLVVGGGLTGLYAAIDAAQRGLRVALVEAGDFGSGATSTAPALAPGAFPYVQRAIRQRDTRWLRRAYAALECATVWQNTAPHCMLVAPGAPPPEGAGEADGIEQPKHKEKERDRYQAVSPQPRRVRTLIPALHTAEFLELSATAWACSVLSLLAGPLRLCSPLKTSAVNRELPTLGDRPARGGVVAHDFMIDGAKAAVCLARTAEALGVTILNYATLCGVQYDDVEGTEQDTREGAEGASSNTGSSGDNDSRPVLLLATVRDDGGTASACVCSSGYVRLRTRGVINCAGAWADEVKQLVPDNALDVVPAAYDRFHVYSYLVAPRTALFQKAPAPARKSSSGGASNSDSGTAAARVEPDAAAAAARFRWLARPGAALQVASTQYSFATMLVSPWHDGTVLLGPSITPIAQLPSRLGNSGGGGGQHRRDGNSSPHSPATTTTTGYAVHIHSADGYRAQRSHILNALGSCGVGVDGDQILSCLSTVVPLARGPVAVPWVESVLIGGHHIQTFRASEALLGDGEDEEYGAAVATSSEQTNSMRSGNSAAVNRDGAGLSTPFVHVYGGTALTARAVAAEAVDTFVLKTTALPADYKKAFRKRLATSSTRYLKLLPESPAAAEEGSSSSGSEPAAAAAATEAARLDAIVAGSFPVHLTDIIARRAHVGYTSPAEAVEAAPGLAAYVGKALGWSDGRVAEEVGMATRFVQSVAVRSE